MKADLALVSCVKLKIDHPAPAKDLYMRSQWFRGARRYAQEHAKSWFILSALRGLVDPETVIEPYEQSLNGADIDERHEWTMKVIRQIAEKELFGDRVVVLAGLHYRQLLINPLILRFKQMDVPMEGLMMGQQLQWLSRRQAIEP
jgi:hypothetical protein